MYSENDTFSKEKEASQLPSFDVVAQSLLADEQIRRLPQEEQGRVIADRFIGALVRHGEVKGSQTTYAPHEILHLMDNILTPDDIRTITGTDGLRKAVNALALDERVGREFGTLMNRLGRDDKNAYTLASTAQLEGYLVAGGRENYVKNPVGGVHTSFDDWVPIMLEHTQRMAENPHMDWMSMGQARELMNSDLPLMKNTGRDWQKAILSAERVDIDVDLVRRSAERIQQTAKTGRDLGARALFLATGSRITAYRSDLDRRSGMA